MAANEAPAPEGGRHAREEDGPTRQCVACRHRASARRLLRVAPGPRHEPVVDIYRRLPGRGVHVCATAGCLRKAVEKGGIGRGLKEPVRVDLDALCTFAAEGLVDSALKRLGIGRRNGRTHFGFDDVERTVAARRASLVVIAADASQRTATELRARAGHVGIPVVGGPAMAVLGAALGRGDVAVVCVEDPALAADVEWALRGAAALRAPQAGGAGGGGGGKRGGEKSPAAVESGSTGT